MTFFLALIAGFVVSHVGQIALPHVPGYSLVLYALLAVGLYGSVHGIDLTELKTHRSIVVSAITVGVLLKALLI